jgi:hypothetical protein
VTYERARDALAQCLPQLFRRGIFTNRDSIGYRDMADKLCDALDKRGFKIISHATYKRLTELSDQRR